MPDKIKIPQNIEDFCKWAEESSFDKRVLGYLKETGSFYGRTPEQWTALNLILQEGPISELPVVVKELIGEDAMLDFDLWICSKI